MTNEEFNLVRPAFGKGSIADLSSLYMRALQAKKVENVPTLMKEAIDEVDHLVFFLIDGMGHATLKNALKNYRVPALSSYLSKSIYIPITSVFPSTTSTATVSIQTGSEPVQHGIIGYTSYLRELGRIFNMISLAPLGSKDTLMPGAVYDDEDLVRLGTIYSHLKEPSVSSNLYIPNKIIDSGLTRFTGRGADIHGYYSLSHMMVTLKRNLASEKKGFHFCYLSTVDTISHKLGPQTEEVAEEVNSIFKLIDERLFEFREIEGDLGVIISADHGHIMIRPDAIIDASIDQKLIPFFAIPVTGDARAPILRINEGKMEEALDYIEERYGGHFMAVRSEDLLKMGYFGISEKRFAKEDRFGDVMLVPIGESGMIDSRLRLLDKEIDFGSLTGVHGGLSQEEMIVPLISRTKPDR
ncbi:MAG: alkaline phosphatase family protein [Thermoplasmatales archaeon]|nr:alkaline phosphatase family protein [Candidatus Thermoplasmatota archaeon]MDA8055488.1 alkaline phosphatase family protein [Thermoplasmatales archaeon]